MKESYLPTTAELRNNWLDNLSKKLPYYAAKYDITEVELTSLHTAALYYDALLKYQNSFTAFNKAITGHKDTIGFGLEAGASEMKRLELPTDILPKEVPEPGIFKLTSQIVAKIKKNTKYDPKGDGNALLIEGVESEIPDRATLKPVISPRLTNDGHPEIIWKKAGMDSIEIQKDSGDGIWTFAAIDTVPNYTDTTPLPSADQTATWRYRAIYRLNDERIGQWCEAVTIKV